MSWEMIVLLRIFVAHGLVQYLIKKVAIKLGTSSKTAMVVQALHRHLLD